jgi:uncharacterized protein (TIGR03083 family)
VAIDPVEALKGECELVSQLVLGLPEEDFAKPTRLPEWNVKELLGHMTRGVDRINVFLDEPPAAAADTDSVSYWTRYDPVTDSPDTAERAKAVAAGYESGQHLAAAWDETWRRAAGRAGTVDRERPVQVSWGPALTLDEYVKTRVLEITVHRMDLESALGLKGWGTDAAISIVDEILEGLLGEEPPTELEWDALDFIDVATGRRSPTDQEREILGELADRFPLLA